MTENEIKEYIEELRHKANTLIKSGYATSGISTHFNKSADLIEELLTYRTTGTVEQCREAVEKMKPKKVTDAVKNTAGATSGYVGSCPNCHYHILIYREKMHCDKCGQKVILEKFDEEKENT